MEGSLPVSSWKDSWQRTPLITIYLSQCQFCRNSGCQAFKNLDPTGYNFLRICFSLKKTFLLICTDSPLAVSNTRKASHNGKASTGQGERNTVQYLYTHTLGIKGIHFIIVTWGTSYGLNFSQGPFYKPSHESTVSDLSRHSTPGKIMSNEYWSLGGITSNFLTFHLLVAQYIHASHINQWFWQVNHSRKWGHMKEQASKEDKCRRKNSVGDYTLLLLHERENIGINTHLIVYTHAQSTLILWWTYTQHISAYTKVTHLPQKTTTNS